MRSGKPLLMIHILVVAPTTGLATAVGVGAAVITALHTPSGLSGTSTFTVTAAEVTAFAIDPANTSVALGLSLQFVATALFSDATVGDPRFWEAPPDLEVLDAA